jgi:hypothetical protein
MNLHAIAAQLNAEMASRSSMRVGAHIKHPDGRTVKITSGYFLDPVYRRVSNHWTWRPVLRNGRLGREESGYGW